MHMPKKDYQFAVGLADSFHICAVSRVRTRASTGYPSSGWLQEVRTVETNRRHLYADPGISKLIDEMHVVFNQCREFERNNGKVSTQDIISLSRQYRAVLRGAADIEEHSDSHFRDFTLWSLFETMFLKSSDTLIVHDLMLWAHETFVFATELQNMAIEEHSNGVPLKQSNYFKSLAVLILTLQFEQFAEMLKLLFPNPAADLLYNHIQKLNLDWLHDEMELVNLNDWTSELKTYVESKHFASDPNINFLAKLMLGDESVVRKMANAVLTEWWQMVPFYVFAKYTSETYKNIGAIAEECKAIWVSGGTQEDEFDPFLAIFQLSDVSLLANIMPNPWLSAHLVDLVYASGFDQPLLSKRIELLLEYGSSLMLESNFWEIGVEYLLQCGIEGKFRLENAFCVMDLESEFTAEKVYRICLEHGMENALTCVVNTMTNRNLCACSDHLLILFWMQCLPSYSSNFYLRSNKWSSALSWALRSTVQLAKTLDTAVNRIVWHASESDLASLHMVEYLDNPMLTPTLSFLYNYYIYHSSLKRGQIQSAAKVLITLIMSPEVPSQFHPVLFSHLIMIFENSQKIHISSEKIYQLIGFFNKYSLSHPTMTKNDNAAVRMTHLKQLLATRLAETVVVV